MARPTPLCRILSAMAQPNSAFTPHGFVLGSPQAQNTSFRVARHTNPVRYCPLWASQSTHFQGFHPGPPQGFKRVLQG